MGKDKDKKTGDKPSSDSGNVGGLKRLGVFAAAAADPVVAGYYFAAATDYFALGSLATAVDAYRGDEMKSVAPRPGSK
jgi:hypothetical protein